jgi:hypothetical protein
MLQFPWRAWLVNKWSQWPLEGLNRALNMISSILELLEQRLI